MSDQPTDFSDDPCACGVGIGECRQGWHPSVSLKCCANCYHPQTAHRLWINAMTEERTVVGEDGRLQSVPIRRLVPVAGSAYEHWTGKREPGTDVPYR